MATEHSHGPNFGRKVNDCPRCTELTSGAAPVQSGWNNRSPETPKTTPHTCGGPVFGKLTAGCPRCGELGAGAEPVRWAPSRREEDERRVQEIRDHNCKTSGCSIVCTFGQW
jgi:hypothetical protein